ncbi:MAG: Ig-like domain-containing protein [Chloroflexi bacterium]|nr:Ig-like domain-containing protein [Chloroflexota bacterium]
MLLRSLAVIAVGAVVLVGLLYVASTVDARPPTVLDVGLTQPLPDDDERAHITTSIEVSFSEPIDPDSATDAVVLDPPTDGTVSWSGSTLIFTPSAPLELATEYTVTVAPGVQDPAGNEMTEPPDPFVFVTVDRPVLAGSDPEDGTRDVPVDAAITLEFSGLMDTASVEEALEVEPAIDYELRWSGERLEIVPDAPLDPATEYVVTVTTDAMDAGGVALADAIRIGFRTVSPGLAVDGLVPADGTNGVSPHTSIAVTLDREVDSESVAGDLLAIDPEVSGTVELVAEPDGATTRRLLRFTPSAPLPPNTTVRVTLEAGLIAADGGRMAEPVTWSFTTGAPQATLSNQVLFLSDRAGVTNVWAMNADGTGQHQVSAEPEPVLDYAAAPDGSSLVVGDGRRLVHLRADGSDRRVLTDPAHLEFDPVFAPDGTRIAFARADAGTGAGLGLWTWEIGAASATAVRLPVAGPDGASPSPAPTEGGQPSPVRAPRYSPDGNAIAYVDLRGAVGILERPGQRLTLVTAAPAAAPAWDAASSAILLRFRSDGPGSTEVEAPVGPLTPDGPTEVGVVRRSGTTVRDAELGASARALSLASDGRIGWIDEEGTVRVATELFEAGQILRALEGTDAVELVLGPVEGVVLVVGPRGDVVRVDLATGERTRLADDGMRVRWLP